VICSGARAQIFKTEINEILRNAPFCRRATPMGSRGSLYDSARREVCTKSRSNDQREAIFTQVQAAEKRNTLLLL
jgi:hypothetical protein